MSSNYMPGPTWGMAPWEDGAEPIIEDVSDGYQCEADGCDNEAVAELSWPMEDHDLPSGIFCQACLDKALGESNP